MFPMPEDNMLIACANECVFCCTAGFFAKVEKTVPVESERVGIKSRVSRGEGGETDCGTFGDCGAVREAECFFGHAVDGYFWED
jgi:hypothetical protein